MFFLLLAAPIHPPPLAAPAMAQTDMDKYGFLILFSAVFGSFGCCLFCYCVSKMRQARASY